MHVIVCDWGRLIRTADTDQPCTREATYTADMIGHHGCGDLQAAGVVVCAVHMLALRGARQVEIRDDALS